MTEKQTHRMFKKQYHRTQKVQLSTFSRARRSGFRAPMGLLKSRKVASSSRSKQINRQRNEKT